MLLRGLQGYARAEGPQAHSYQVIITWFAFAGGHRIRDPPVPIPNTEVKPDTADGTARETVWESRSLPALFNEARCLFEMTGFSFCWPC